MPDRAQLELARATVLMNLSTDEAFEAFVAAYVAEKREQRAKMKTQLAQIEEQLHAAD